MWLGLYDFKARAALDTKDDDSVRELIVQKYEKKRFYVDPSCIRHTVEPAPEPSKNQNGPLHSPPSKFSSGLIGSTLQLHQQNKNSATKTTAATPPAAVPVKMTPPPSVSEKPPAVFPSSVNLSKPAAVATPPPITHQQTPDPFGGIQTKSNVDFFAPKVANDSFANFDAATIYTSPTSNPMTATHSAQMDFGFPPMALPVAPVVAPVEPTPAKQAVSKPIMSSQQQQQEDRYAALKDLDNIFKTSVELTSKSNSDSEQHAKQPTVGGVSSPSNRATYNPFATDFSSTQQLNTSPWPISASPSGPGFAAPSAGFGSGQGKVPDFFASPWDTPSAAPSASTSGFAANPTDFFNTKGFSNPWSESHENDNNKPLPAFGQFGFNKKNPFL